MAHESGSSNKNASGFGCRLSWPVIGVFVAICMSVFQLWSSFNPIDPLILYNAHLGFGMLIGFLAYRASGTQDSSKMPWYDVLMLALTLVSIGYFCREAQSFLYRMGVNPTRADFIFGSIIILLILELSRRVIGPALPLLAIISLIYGRYGFMLSGFLSHRGVQWDRLVSYVVGQEGILSTPIAASASFVFMFILFSAFLNVTGTGQLFIDLSKGLTGAARGGPAKMAVVSSSLFGTISGGSATNVVATGTFTIPLMKNMGYSPAFAAAVEAVASTGGQIMPPIMGTGAFIMAELIGIPYLNVMGAAMLPAVLYYLAVYFMVDFEAGKLDLRGLPKKELPNARAILLRDGYLLTPLVVLILCFVVFRLSIVRCALYGLATVILVSLIRPQSRLSASKIIEAFSNAGQSALSLIAACACAGIVIGVLAITGLGLKFTQAVLNIAGGNLALSLVMTMMSCLVLGMGLPTTASYVICATVAVPPLMKLGVGALAAHLFVFYFACLSAITPPVAVAAYAAASISKAKPFEVGLTAVKLGLTAFLVPYMFVYGPEILGSGTPIRIALAAATSILGAICLAGGLERWAFGRHLSLLESLLLCAAALLLIKPGGTTDLVGLALLSPVIIRHLAWRSKSSAAI